MSGEVRIPKFRRGVKFRFDPVRGAWVLLAPEKVFMPDAVATEILKLVDGCRNIGAIADELAARFAASRELIVSDISAALEDLAMRAAIDL
jgi:pyrroloquinoline quinone biosynthesis protein D